MPTIKSSVLTQKRLTIPTLHRKPGLFKSPSQDTTATNFKKRVYAFDEKGNMTTKQTGTHNFYLKQQTLFYILRSYSWSWLIIISVFLYLTLVAWITTMYYGWAWACGVRASTSTITSLYFTVVSLAANGGYMGEAADMGDPSNVCYYGRTVIVMMASFTNIIFVGLVAALVVGKAESTAKFANRIVFSYFCTLTTLPEQRNVWCLKFRMANVASQKPLAQGQLRLFCVLAEPLDGEHVLMDVTHAKESYKRLIKCEKHHSCHGKTPPTQSMLEDTPKESRRSFDDTMSSAKGGDPFAFMDYDKDSAEASHSQEQSHSGPHLHSEAKGSHSKRSLGVAQGASPEAKDDQSIPFSSSWHRGQMGTKKNDDDTSSNISQDQKGFVAVKVHSDAHSEGSKSLPAYGGTAEVEHDIVHPPLSLDLSALSGAREDASIRQTNNPGPANVGSKDTFHEEDPLLGKSSTRNQERLQGEPNNESMSPRCLQQVKLNITELRWTSPEEIFLDKKSRQLSLWYPGTICHVIDERSPLHRFMNAPFNDSPFIGPIGPNKCSSDKAFARVDAPEHLQIVAVFDAIEMESGATIMAKHTYTFTDILKNYKFSDKLTYARCENAEIYLDYHYFNVVEPLLGDETSAVESEM